MHLTKPIRFCVLLIACLCPCNKANAVLHEDFEGVVKHTYKTSHVDLGSGPWLFDRALLGNSESDVKNGAQSARLNRGIITMLFDVDGADEVLLWHANAGFTGDADASFVLEYSRDQGSTWNRAGSVVRSGEGQLRKVRIRIHLPGPVRFRIVQRSGGRLNIDDIRITAYGQSSEQTPVLRLTCHYQVVAPGDTILYEPSGAALRTLRLSFQNMGGNVLTVSSVHLHNVPVSPEEDTPFELEPSDNRELVLHEPAPDVFGSALTLTIFSNDTENPVLQLVVLWQPVSSAKRISLARAHSADPGTYVTVAGIVSWKQHGAPRIYFQDQTAGMAWVHKTSQYPEYGYPDDPVNDADSLYLTGRIATFNGVRHIVTSENDRFTTYLTKSVSNEPVQANDVPADAFINGQHQSELIEMRSLRFLHDGFFSEGNAYKAEAGTHVVCVIIAEHSGFMHLPVPDAPVHVRGIAGLLSGRPVLIVREANDLETAGAAPLISSPYPWQTHATAHSVTFEWNSRSKARSIVWYGLTEKLELGIQTSKQPSEVHYKTLNNLVPATVYHVRIGLVSDSDTLRSARFLVSTGSPEGSTGQLMVHFNGMNNAQTAHTDEQGTPVLLQVLLNRIAQARYSIDMALYSIGGHTGARIAQKLEKARLRGVCIRIITDHEAGTQAFEAALEQADIPHIDNHFGIAGASQHGIHHNKYMIFDYRGGSASEVWVATGSWNPTDAGTNRHYQNLVEVQDVALAGAYTLEFNQKWGSATPVADPEQSRFGERKKSVSPELFWPGGRRMRLYFSPQDKTEEQIAAFLSAARDQIHFASMLVTRHIYLQALQARHAHGVGIKGLVGQPDQTGSIYTDLAHIEGVFAHDAATFGLLHHKYALADVNRKEKTGSVLTGSMNWTRAAALHNDENVLIIDCAETAAAYLDEFELRYKQARRHVLASESYILSDRYSSATAFGEVTNRPNPFSGRTNIVFSLNKSATINISVYDINGRLVHSVANDQVFEPGKHYTQFDASALSSGVYIYRVEADNTAVQTGKMVHIR